MMKTNRLASIFWLGSLALLVAAPSANAAEAEKTVAVVMTGEAAELAAAAREGFLISTWTPTVVAASDELLACIKARKDGDGCLLRLLGEHTFVAAVSIDDAGSGEAIITGSLLRTADGDQVVIPVRVHCGCKVTDGEKAAAAVREVIAKLIADVQFESSPSYVNIQCEPKDAVVTIDGVRSGLGRLKVKPGEVTIVANKDGYEPKRYTVDVDAGEVVDLDIELRLVERSQLSLVAVGLGVAGAMTVGIGVFFIDEISSIDGDQRNPEGSRVAKVATIGAGVGLLAGAGVSYFFARRRNAERLRAAETVAVLPTSGGLALSLSGSF